jgi:amino acid transporter
LTEVRESIDISQRDDVDKLKSNAVGLGGVLFACLAGAAPITAMLGNVPFAVGYGNGIGAPSGFMFATIVLTIFSVGYVAMCRKITAVGGFYAFISHSLGRVAGVASGLIGAIAYMSIEAALLGAIGYFARGTFSERLGVELSWPIYAIIGALIIAGMSYFDVDLSLKVLGVLLATEVAVLLLFDFAALFQVGHEWATTLGDAEVAVKGKLNFESVNIVSGFGNEGAVGTFGAGLGLFMAFWSWVGFEAAPNYAEESRDPVRNVPRATYISVLALGIFYTFTSWMVVTAWGDTAGQAGFNLGPGDFFYLPTTEYLGGFVTKLMSWLIITGCLACGAAFHNAAMRYWYAMGREGLLPRALGKTHPIRKTPYIASLFQSVLSLIIILIYVFAGGKTGADAEGYAYNAAYLGAYTQLALLATLLLLILQTAVSISIPLYFKKNHPSEVHPWKTVGAPILATVLQVGVIILLIANLKNAGGKTGFTPYVPWVAIAIIVIGVAAALYTKARKPDVYENLGRFVNSGQTS